MTLEGSVICPECKKETFVCSDVPEGAWYPMGANFNWKEECMSCGEVLELEGRVESKIELS